MPHPPFHIWTFPDGSVSLEFYRVGEDYLLRFPDLADFLIAGADLEVTCVAAPSTPQVTLEHLYLNQVLPLVLSKLGKLVFHASAVESDGGAIAFVGMTGRGKSTLAASFAANGRAFLTDDGLALERRGGGYFALPSHPSVRLREDSETAVAGLGAKIAPPAPYASKSRFMAGGDLAYCSSPRLLRAAYFLGEGSAQNIVFSRMSAAEAFVEWAKNAFLLDTQDGSLLEAHFDQTAELANDMACYRLDYPRRFDDLQRLREAIAQHAANESSET